MPAVATRGDALRIDFGGTELVSLQAVGAISGTYVTAAAGRNGKGTGVLRSTGDGTSLSWRAPGSSTFGPAVACGSDGAYLLEDGEDFDKWVRVQVDVSFLSAQPSSAKVTLRDWFNGLGPDDVTSGEASAGDVHDYEATITNDSPGAVSGITIWVDSGVSGLEISTDGISYSSPTTEATGLDFGSLSAGGTTTLYLRRTIGVGASSDPEVLNHLHVTGEGL